ncbi:MAG: hypothetical protein MMC23_005813 [Stictis urceolatum]|nr:hypothetical protein [Stictis urceolata]
MFQYHSDRLVAAVITLTYNKILRSGLEYSIIYTGAALVFLRVPAEDSATLFYRLADPNTEVSAALENDISRLPYTSVGQFLSCCLLAIDSDYRSQAWRISAQNRARKWQVNDTVILHEILERVRTKPPSSAFGPRLYIKTPRSPIVTRSKSCQGPLAGPSYRSDNSVGSDNGENHPSTTPSRN